MLSDQIKSDMTTAMKAGDALRLSVLRMLSSEMNYKLIDLKHELADADVVAVIQKEAKKRREAIEAYQKAGRAESAAKEAEELKILEVYLPKQLTEDEIRAEIGDLSMYTDFSSAMRVLSSRFKGRADGALVVKIVKEKLPA